MTAQVQEGSKITILFELEQQVRNATSKSSLRFLIVNQTRRLVHFDQAVFFSLSNTKVLPRVEAISTIANVDRATPFVHWTEGVAKNENQGPDRLKRHVILPKNINQSALDNWDELSPPHVLWVPLVSPMLGTIGVLWLARHAPWDDDKEMILVDHVALTYAHALQQFEKSWNLSGLFGKLYKRPVAIFLIVVFCLGMWLPVTMTALGPAEIMPVAPFVVTSPIHGVVKGIIVQANQEVKVGQQVVQLDDTEMRNVVELSIKALEVADAQLKRAERASFVDSNFKEALAELEAQVDLRKTELDFAREQLGRATLVSGKNGVAVVNRPDLWVGKPVTLGERILEIADPAKVELDIMLPVQDAIVLEPGNRVVVFLDSNPLAPVDARIVRFEYDPHLTELSTLAYRVTAELVEPSVHPRIGLRGIAKVYGESVTLFYYIFRRPITALRQWGGW